MQKSYSVESIYKDLKAKIESGYYLTNNKLPEEKQLTTLYGVGKQAVRMAVERLVKEGAVKRIKGRGTFVVLRPKRHLQGLVDDRWNFEFLRKNLSKIPKEYDYFNRNLPVLCFEIIWHKDENPVCFEKSFVDPIKTPMALKLLQSQDEIHPIDFCAQTLNSGTIEEKFELVKTPKIVLRHLNLVHQEFVIMRTLFLSSHIGELLAFSLLYYHPAVQITQRHRI